MAEAFASFFDDDDEFAPDALPVDDAELAVDDELLDAAGTELLAAARESVR